MADSEPEFPDNAMDAETRSMIERLEEDLRRPAEMKDFHLELKTALATQDVQCCRELLELNRNWVGHLRGYEHANLLAAAIVSGPAAGELVDLLLAAGVPALCVDDQLGPEYQCTPLVTAARAGRLDLVQRLVRAGADLFWSSPTGANVLSLIRPSRARADRLADTPGMAEVRAWLMAQGVRIDPLCADSRRKLRWASRDPGGWADVPGLLSLGIPMEETQWTSFMLRIALGTAAVSEVESLESEELGHRDGWSRTPFLLAVVAGNLELAQALAERGSDLEAKGHCGVTALHLAAEYNRVPLIEWLLAQGMDIDVRDEFGDSSLHSAVAHGCEEAARVLLDKGADLREKDETGSGLIHCVPIDGDFVLLRLLVEKGAEINAVAGDGTWPLRDACEVRNSEAVAYLLRAGADPNLTSTGGIALFAAVASDSLECVRLLVEAGSDVNARDCDGWTCLFHLRSVPVARHLLEHGADPALTDQCGSLPEDWMHMPRPVRRMLQEWRMAQVRDGRRPRE